MTTPQEQQLQHAQFSNGEAIQAFCPGATYVASPNNTSVDPFVSKTNKYAESQAIAINSTVQVHVRFGASDIGAADATYYMIPANSVPVIIPVPKGKPYVRVFTASAASVFVTEGMV